MTDVTAPSPPLQRTRLATVPNDRSSTGYGKRPPAAATRTDVDELDYGRLSRWLDDGCASTASEHRNTQSLFPVRQCTSSGLLQQVRTDDVTQMAAESSGPLGEMHRRRAPWHSCEMIAMTEDDERDGSACRFPWRPNGSSGLVRDGPPSDDDDDEYCVVGSRTRMPEQPDDKMRPEETGCTRVERSSSHVKVKVDAMVGTDDDVIDDAFTGDAGLVVSIDARNRVDVPTTTARSNYCDEVLGCRRFGWFTTSVSYPRRDDSIAFEANCVLPDFTAVMATGDSRKTPSPPSARRPTDGLSPKFFQRKTPRESTSTEHDGSNNVNRWSQHHVLRDRKTQSRDFSQQTIEHASTQTPIVVRVHAGLDGIRGCGAGEGTFVVISGYDRTKSENLMMSAGTDVDVTQFVTSCDRSIQTELMSERRYDVTSRDFYTQTLGLEVDDDVNCEKTDNGSATSEELNDGCDEVSRVDDFGISGLNGCKRGTDHGSRTQSELRRSLRGSDGEVVARRTNSRKHDITLREMDLKVCGRKKEESTTAAAAAAAGVNVVKECDILCRCATVEKPHYCNSCKRTVIGYVTPANLNICRYDVELQRLQEMTDLRSGVAKPKRTSMVEGRSVGVGVGATEMNSEKSRRDVQNEASTELMALVLHDIRQLGDLISSKQQLHEWQGQGHGSRGRGDRDARRARRRTRQFDWRSPSSISPPERERPLADVERRKTTAFETFHDHVTSDKDRYRGDVTRCLLRSPPVVWNYNTPEFARFGRQMTPRSSNRYNQSHTQPESVELDYRRHRRQPFPVSQHVSTMRSHRSVPPMQASATTSYPQFSTIGEHASRLPWQPSHGEVANGATKPTTYFVPSSPPYGAFRPAQQTLSGNFLNTGIFQTATLNGNTARMVYFVPQAINSNGVYWR